MNPVDGGMCKAISSVTNQQLGAGKKQGSRVVNRRVALGLGVFCIAVLVYEAYDLTHNSAKRLSSTLLTSLTSSTTSMSSATATLPSSTPTSSKELVSLQGESYVGWDGNGTKEEGYSSLANEKMVLVSVDGKPEIFAETTSDSSGLWEIDDIPTGDYWLYPDGHPEFRYMCQSNKDFAPASGNGVAFGGYSLSLNESRKMSFEFSNGFLTLPLLKGTRIRVNAFVDEGNNTNWMNQPNGDPGHQGTD